MISIFKDTNLFWWVKIGSICFVVLIILMGVGLTFLAHDPKPAALFADNVMRPVIGDKAVIKLEGFIFGIQDNVNHFTGKRLSKNNYTSNIKTQPEQVSVIIPPQNIVPYIDKEHPLQNEGIWRKIEGKDLFTTFIRTDSQRDYAVVNLVYIPMKNISLRTVAGTKYPGGPLFVPGSGVVPKDIQESGSLIAAFNGGFKEKDGHYGMYANNVMYAAMKKDLATIFIYKDGHLSLLPYDGNALPADVIAARQNGPFLVRDGKTSELTSRGIDWWAGTASGGYITWRSGMGVTKNGDLIYAVGPSLTPTALADALRLAGSNNAMELDINDYWVRFNLFTWDSTKKSYTWTPLTKGLADGGKEYLHGYEKDFFYLYKKNS